MCFSINCLANEKGSKCFWSPDTIQNQDLEEELDAPENMTSFAVSAVVNAVGDVFAVEVFCYDADIFERCPRRADNPAASPAQGIFCSGSEGNVGALFAVAGENVPLTFFGGVVVIAVAEFGLPSFILEVGFGVLSVYALK